MAGRIKVAGTWRSTPAVYTKVSGSWRTVTKAYIKVAGTWRIWFLAAITDSFTRTTTAGTLGNTDTGNAWSVLRGDWYANGSKARGTLPASNNNAGALAVVELGSQNKVVSAEVSPGMGVVVWGVDANNWWAVAQTNYNYSYSYNTTCTSCSTCSQTVYCCGSCPCNNGAPDTNDCCCGGYYCSYQCIQYSAYGDCMEYDCVLVYDSCVSTGCACGNAIEPQFTCCGNCCTEYYTCCTDYACTQTATATQWQLKVFKCVAGTVTEVNVQNTAEATPPQKITVTTSGDTLSYTASRLDNTSPYTYSAAQTTPNKGTKPGIITVVAGPTGVTNLLDNFAASPN